jgi:hypothetical protein
VAVGLAVAISNDILDALGNNSSITTLPIATPFIQLHTGDPGAAGTSNVAGNATRKSVSFGTPANGLMSNDAAITWSSGEVDTSEDYTHVSLWDASTSGTFLGSGLMTANAVVIGDQFTIPIGDLDLSFATAA